MLWAWNPDQPHHLCTSVTSSVTGYDSWADVHKHTQQVRVPSLLTSKERPWVLSLQKWLCHRSRNSSIGRSTANQIGRPWGGPWGLMTVELPNSSLGDGVIVCRRGVYIQMGYNVLFCLLASCVPQGPHILGAMATWEWPTEIKHWPTSPWASVLKPMGGLRDQIWEGKHVLIGFGGASWERTNIVRSSSVHGGGEVQTEEDTVPVGTQILSQCKRGCPSVVRHAWVQQFSSHQECRVGAAHKQCGLELRAWGMYKSLLDREVA